MLFRYIERTLLSILVIGIWVFTTTFAKNGISCDWMEKSLAWEAKPTKNLEADERRQFEITQIILQHFPTDK